MTASDETSPLCEQIERDLREGGIEFRVCADTLARRRINTAAVITKAVLVPSGIAEISRPQGREGYVYLRYSVRRRVTCLPTHPRLAAA